MNRLRGRERLEATTEATRQLRSCELVGPTTARAQIEAHGFRVTVIDDGTGYEAFRASARWRRLESSA